MSPGQTNTKPDKAELEAAIDALLKDIDSTCHRFENPAQAQDDDELAEYTRAVEAANKARPASEPTPEAAPSTPAEPSAQPSSEEVGESAERAIEASAEGMNALLEEAADRLIESLEQEMPPAVPSEPEAATESEATAEAESEPEPTDEPETATITEPTDGTDLIERALDSLLAETPEAGPEAAVEPTGAEETTTPVDTAEPVTSEPMTPEPVTPEPVTPEPTRDVFADLDAAFDDLLDGTFETADGQAVDTDGVDTSPDRTLMLDSATPSTAAPTATQASPPTPEPVAPKATLPAAAETAAPTTETSTAQAQVAPVVTTPEAAPESGPVRVPTKKTKGRKLAGALDGFWLRVRPLLAGAVRGVGGTVRPLGARALIVLSKPLEGKPPQVRDSIGWVALWTLFLAVCVWAYAMLRPAPVPPNDGRASAVVTPDTPRDP